MSNEKIPATQGVIEAMNKVLDVGRSASPSLYEEAGESGWRKRLLKEITPENASEQGVATGRKPHPFNFKEVTEFQTSNEHHSTCIHTKTNSTVGLGFKSDRVDSILNPLCDVSFHDVLNDVGEDYFQVGTGAMEVIREDDKILGIHHVPIHTLYLNVENDRYDRHFEVISDEGTTIQKRVARFGDKKSFLRRMGAGGNISGSPISERAEIILFRQPTSLSRWYGYPDWLSAIASIELTQALKQFRYDFFLNRGVPEFMLFISGAKMQKEDWEKVEKALKANIGIGNSHKSLALNLPEEVKIQLEKLAVESTGEDDFGPTSESLALSIVSAHRVPPLLAGIQIPGKLGATNELPNALMAFQVLVVGQAQRNFQQTLGATLGNDSLNGGLGLSVEDFKCNTITEEIDVGQMDTVARMRQTPTQAAQEGRDLNDGVRD